MAAVQPSVGRYVFLDYLRAVAAWLVVWDHLASFPRDHGLAFAPADWVRRNVSEPLGIIQDFGWFGVALFFLISGFIISDRARVESAVTFVVRRVLRIYPMLAVALALSILLIVGVARTHLHDVLLNLTLINYLVVPQVALVGVAWTLIIEVVFYALTAVTQVAKGSPHRIAFNLAIVALTIWKRGAFGPSFGLFATAAAYLPVLIMGQTIYWWLAKGRLSAAWGFAYMLAAGGLFLWGLRAILPTFLPATNSYLISLAYAVLLFVALLHVKLPERRVVRFLADTSYSVYLMHGIIGPALLAVLVKHVSPGLSVVLAAGASLAAAFVTYRLVELPAQRLGRRLTRARGPAPAT